MKHFVTHREFEEYAEHAQKELEKLRTTVQQLKEEVNRLAGTQPSSFKLTIGAPMPGAITVDTTNETATLTFYDDHGDVAEAPEGATVTFSSDTPDVATVETDTENPLQGDITPVAVGTANITASVAGATEPDGTPFPDQTVQVTVSAGEADSDALILSV